MQTRSGDGGPARPTQDAHDLVQRCFGLMFERSGEALFLVEAEADDRFRFIAVNPTFTTVTGLPGEAVAGSLVSDIIPASSRDLVLGYYHQALRDGRPVTWLEESTYPSGARTGRVTVVPVIDASSGRRFLAGSVYDLTPELRQEAYARVTAAQLRAIFDNAGDAILLTNDAGEYVEANPAAVRLLGYSREELLTRHIWDLAVEGQRDRAIAMRDEFLAQGHLSGEFEARRKDGTSVVTEFSAVARISPGLHLTIGRDITARKQAEEAIRRSESYYRNIVENAPVVFFTTDRHGVFTLSEGSGLAGAGLRPGEVVGKSAFELYGGIDIREHDGRVSHGAEVIPRVLAGETVRGITEAGDAYYDNTFLPLRAADGTIEGVAGIAADITELARASRALQERSELFRAMIERGSDVISLHDAQGVMRYQSPSITPVLGYDATELIGQPVIDFIHPDDRRQAEKHIDEVRATPGPHPPFEIRFLHRDGSWRWFDCHGTNLLDDPAVRSVVFNSHDITARKAADRALRRSEAHFRTLIENMSDIVTVLDTGGVISYESPSLLRVLGHEPQDLVGRVVWDFIHPEDRPALQEALAAGAVSNDCPYQFRFLNSNGAWRILESVGRLVDEGEKGISAVMVSRDVTRRIRAERDSRLLQDVARALNDAEDADSAIATVLQLVCVAQQWAFAEAWFPAADGDALVQSPLWHGGPRFEAVKAAGSRLRFAAGQGLPGEAWRRGAPVYSPDLTSDPLFVRAAEARSLELRTAVAVPGRAGAAPQPVSVVLLFAALEQRPEGDGETALLGVVASQLSAAIQRKRAESAWRRIDRLLKTILTGAPIIAFAIDADGVFTMSEGRGLQVLGLSPGELVGTSAFDFSKDYPDVLRDLRRALGGEVFVSYSDVADRTFQTWYSPLAMPDGRDGAVGVSMDISERRRLEDQLRQAHKLESIGRLAGGVAHDFNNLLMVIIGYSELVLSEMGESGRWRHEIEQIERAGQRASALTQQLLAFSRKQILQPRSIDLNDVVHDVTRMLQRVIGENIELRTELAPALRRVRADPNQMAQVLMNLAVNARDAMPQGGRLTVSTENIAAEPASPLTGPGVRLAVSDTGVGMSEAVRKRMFEPFFTTKPVGKGTGMGLATVYGIVKQSGGDTAVVSAEGSGTTVSIVLPEDATPGSPAEVATEQPLPTGAERILLVEDEGLVRQLAVRTLRRLGYDVTEAADGAEALRLYEARNAAFDLLITDVVMPQMSGPELVDRVLGLNGNTRVLYISGYADDAVLQHGILKNAGHFLQKPFSALVLARTVRLALDEAR